MGRVTIETTGSTVLDGESIPLCYSCYNDFSDQELRDLIKEREEGHD